MTLDLIPDQFHVLIVDDDEAFLTFTETLLTAIGVKYVSKAANGRDAFHLLKTGTRVVDCILCDYAMEPGTGLQLLQVVRTGMLPVRADACFILLTASGDPSTVAAAAQLDVNGYLVKPVTPQKLRTAISMGRARPIKVDVDRYKLVQLPPSA